MGVDITDIQFPAILFHKDFALLARNLDTLTTTTAYGLKKGKYNDVLIVDSGGRRMHVVGARKAAGTGRFGGWNIFFNPRIKVDLVFDEQPKPISVDQFKARLLRSFQEWEGWAAGENFDEIERGVKQARSIDEVFAALQK